MARGGVPVWTGRNNRLYELDEGNRKSTWEELRPTKQAHHPVPPKTIIKKRKMLEILPKRIEVFGMPGGGGGGKIKNQRKKKRGGGAPF